MTKQDKTFIKEMFALFLMGVATAGWLWVAYILG